jgi:hypothetical protein
MSWKDLFDSTCPKGKALEERLEKQEELIEKLYQKLGLKKEPELNFFPFVNYCDEEEHSIFRKLDLLTDKLGYKFEMQKKEFKLRKKPKKKSKKKQK